MGIALGPITAGRSMGVLAIVGVVWVLHGWGLLTNWGGVWTHHVAAERQRLEQKRRLPLSRSGLGRLAIGVTRSDNDASRGLRAIGAMFAGALFLVTGVLLAVGALST
jgi:uncharacterized 2Fe-2S/4Fe-4S cluster protein (DUF4445 family)